MTSSNNNTKLIVRRELLVREFLAMMFLVLILIGLALALPAEYKTTELDNPSTGAVKAPWLIVWLQVLLGHFSPRVAAFIIPTAVFLILCALPWLPKSAGPALPGKYRLGLHQAVVLFIALALVFLTFWGL